MMKKILVPALAFVAGAVCVPAAEKDYNPVEALREGRAEAPDVGADEKKRSDTLALAAAAEYFFGFGGDLPGADGWGASLSFTVHFDSDSPKWDFVGGVELLGFTAESDLYTHNGHEVKETLQSANILLQGGLSREIGDSFAVEALLGLGLGATYGEVKGDDIKTSSSVNWTTTVSAKILGEYRLNEHWSAFAAFRFAYISPSIASKIAGWHNLDLFSRSVELGLRVRF